MHDISNKRIYILVGSSGEEEPADERVSHSNDAAKSCVRLAPSVAFWKSTPNSYSLPPRPCLACLYFLPLTQVLDQGQHFYGRLSKSGFSVELTCQWPPQS